MLDKAIFELSEKLRHPSDIKTKLPTLKENIKNELSYHSNGFKLKMLEAYSGINRFTDYIDILKTKFENFKINKAGSIKLLEGFSKLIKDYDKVEKISQAHKNFQKIKSFTDNFKNIDTDPQDENIEIYHKNIYEKEEFVCEVELYNYELEREDFSYIEVVINKVKKRSYEFEIVLIEIASEFIENYELMGKINKILIIEEERDKITSMARKGEKGNDRKLAEIAKMYPRYITREPKDLASKIVKTLKAAIKEKFDKIDTEKIFIKKLYFVMDDLKCIYEKIKLEHFKFEDFLNEYHKNLKEKIKNTIDRLDAGEILLLIEFKTKYYSNIEASFNKVWESLEGGAIVENESKLLERYSKTVSEKLKYWIGNISESEKEKFYSRDNNFGSDEDGKLISPGFISLLQIIKSQLEPIVFNKRVFLEITESVKIYCEKFKKTIMNAVKQDFKLVCQSKSKPGFEDYCIMLGNSGLKLTQYITSLPEYQKSEVRDLGNIFLEILRGCNYFLAELVLITSEPVIKKIFTEEWISADSTWTLILTIEDFLEDYQKTMANYSFKEFIVDVAKSICEAYFKRCKSKHIVIDTVTADVWKSDYESIKELLSRYTKVEIVEKNLSLMLRLVPFFEMTNEESLVQELKLFKLENSEISSQVIKNIFVKRNNLSKKLKTKMIENITEIFGTENVKSKNKKRYISKFLL